MGYNFNETWFISVGTWISIIRFEWIECPAWSGSDSRPVHTSTSINCFGYIGEVHIRWSGNQSIVSVFSRRICCVSKSISCDVSFDRIIIIIMGYVAMLMKDGVSPFWQWVVQYFWRFWLKYVIQVWMEAADHEKHDLSNMNFVIRQETKNYPKKFFIFLIFKLCLIFSHSLLDQKINNVLSISNDQVVLMAIQSIIQNMLATEDPSQQQLHFLQSCGFGGLWRFAGPFTKPSVSQHQMFISFLIPSKFYKYPLSFRPLQYNLMGESSELFVNCLEAMVETCLPVEESAVLPPRPYHLSSSLSSLTLGSPTDKGNPLTKPP